MADPRMDASGATVKSTTDPGYPVGTRHPVPDRNVDLAWLGATLASAGVHPAQAQLIINDVQNVVANATIQAVRLVVEAVQEANRARSMEILAMANNLPNVGWYRDRDTLVQAAAEAVTANGHPRVAGL